jgi:tRNA(fMet)-specific endonuclease VapC
MKYTLDTNIISAVVREDLTVLQRLKDATTDLHEISIPAFAYYETKCGLELPKYAKKNAAFERLVARYTLLPLDTKTLDQAARIYQQLRAQGTPLEDADILIAASALEHKAILVTDNTKHFARIPNLQLENWIER